VDELLVIFLLIHAFVGHEGGVLMVMGGCVSGKICAQTGIVWELDRRIARELTLEMEDCEGLDRA